MPIQNSVIKVDSPKPTGSSVSVLNDKNDGKILRSVKNIENIDKNIFQCVSCPVLGEKDPLFVVHCVGKPSIKVFQSCVDGICQCEHFIGIEKSQLLPCRIASFLRQEGSIKINQIESDFLWTGFTEGFKIVDPGCNTTYDCRNYKSILDKKFYGEMCDIIKNELVDGLVTEVKSKPRCIHALGGVEKSNGKLRPITDCSMPDKKP